MKVPAGWFGAPFGIAQGPHALRRSRPIRLGTYTRRRKRLRNSGLAARLPDLGQLNVLNLAARQGRGSFCMRFPLLVSTLSGISPRTAEYESTRRRNWVYPTPQFCAAP